MANANIVEVKFEKIEVISNIKQALSQIKYDKFSDGMPYRVFLAPTNWFNLVDLKRYSKETLIVRGATLKLEYPHVIVPTDLCIGEFNFDCTRNEWWNIFDRNRDTSNAYIQEKRKFRRQLTSE